VKDFRHAKQTHAFVGDYRTGLASMPNHPHMRRFGGDDAMITERFKRLEGQWEENRDSHLPLAKLAPKLPGTLSDRHTKNAVRLGCVTKRGDQVDLIKHGIIAAGLGDRPTIAHNKFVGHCSYLPKGFHPEMHPTDALMEANLGPVFVAPHPTDSILQGSGGVHKPLRRLYKTAQANYNCCPATVREERWTVGPEMSDAHKTTTVANIALTTMQDTSGGREQRDMAVQRNESTREIRTREKQLRRTLNEEQLRRTTVEQEVKARHSQIGPHGHGYGNTARTPSRQVHPNPNIRIQNAIAASGPGQSINITSGQQKYFRKGMGNSWAPSLGARTHR